MKCIDCKYMTPVDTDGLYICTNENSPNFMEYTGICCEDECKEGDKDEM